MTPEQITLVKESWAKVAPIADQAADIFYDKLFTTAPQVRPLFPDDMSGQKKALMGILATAVNSLDNLEAILPAVQQMGVRHVAYGTEPAHYDVVGACLLETLDAGLGDAFTPDVKEAWTVTYGALAGVMKEAAAQAIANGTAPAVRTPPGANDEGPISAAEKELVKASWAKVAPIADTAATIFYDRLFEVAPGVRPMFKEDMTGQKKALMGMLATAVNGLDNLDAIVPAVQQMGVRHAGYGAEPAHYDVVGECLLFTLEKGLGDAFTPETKAAWTKTYGVIAKVMTDAAADAPSPEAKPEKKKGFFSRLFG